MRVVAITLLLAACAAPLRSHEVTLTCPGHYWRGVVVSPMHVLSSRHVLAACGDESITVSGRRLRVDSISDEGDAALLATSWESWSEWAIPGPPPTANEELCDVRGKCAEVIGRGLGWFLWNRQTHPGDSGSGLYDSKGRLVGLVSGAGTIAVNRDVWGDWLKRLPRVCLDCRWP